MKKSVLSTVDLNLVIFYRKVYLNRIEKNPRNERDGEINILKCVIKNRMRLGSITDKFSLESTRLGVNKRQKRATSLE